MTNEVKYCIHILHFHRHLEESDFTKKRLQKERIACSAYDRKFCNHTRKSKGLPFPLPKTRQRLVCFIARCTQQNRASLLNILLPPPPADYTSVRELRKTRLTVFSDIPQLLEFLRQIIFALYLQSKLNQGFLVRVVIAYLIFAFELFIFQMIQGSKQPLWACRLAAAFRAAQTGRRRTREIQHGNEAEIIKKLAHI